MPNPRGIAAKILIKIENDNAYSNLTLNSYLEGNDFSQQDKAFITSLVYGVIERKITLDYVLKKFIKTPLRKVNEYSLANLRVALYQIMFMDKIPQSAAVNEAVKLVKASKESRNAAFVNAVLRNVLREDNLLPRGESVSDLSVVYSCPEPIIESLIKDYGKEDAVMLLKESLKPADFSVKVNTLKIEVNDFCDKIGVATEICEPYGAVVLKQGFSISENSLYKKGLFYVQDIASQRVVSILAPKPYERMLDMCAAPGGKSFASAISMENKGEIISCDLYPHKAILIEESSKRLGFEIINPCVCDASVYNAELGEFDCILCDVPCSGLGIIRRKPEIKYKDFSSFDDLLSIQFSILSNAKNYLKSKGRILYSTCTLRKAENDNIVDRFLSENKDFKLEYSHTFMPHKDGTDGFYCALLIRE